MKAPIHISSRWAGSATLLLALLLMHLSAGCRRGTDSGAEPGIRGVTISAHRGGPEPGYPENALPTLQHTAKRIPGVMLEVDVRPTRDRQLVLLHDRTLDRTTTYSGPLERYTLAELSEAKLRDGGGHKVDMSIPTLEEVLSWLRGSDAYLSLDIKDTAYYDTVIGLVRSYELSQKVELITYNLPDAQRIHRTAPEMHLSVSIGSYSALRRFRASGIAPDRAAAFTGLNLKEPELYEALHETGMVVTLGTLGNLDRRAATRGDALYARWRGMGVDRFATDRPFALEALWSTGGLNPDR